VLVNTIVEITVIFEGRLKRIEPLVGAEDAAVALDELIVLEPGEEGGLIVDDSETGGTELVIETLELVMVLGAFVGFDEMLDPGTISDGDVEVAVDVLEVITAGKVDWVGITNVLNRGSEDGIETVASGPTVTGTLNIAHNCATAVNVSERRQLWQQLHSAGRYTLLVCSIARCYGAIVHSFNIHVICTETWPFTGKCISSR